MKILDKMFVAVLLIVSFTTAGCKSTNLDSDCGAGCLDAAEDTVADAVADTSDDVRDTILCDAPIEVIEVLPAHDCEFCTTDADCGAGYECQLEDTWGYCQRYCADDGDCVSGYVCNQSAFPSVCRPFSYACYVGCISDYPCDEGMCCDFSDSRCKECKQECQVCLHDYDCASGLRCHMAEDGLTGKCVPECGDGVCPEPAHQTCTDNGRGVMMCIPDEGYCPGCKPPTPFQLPDGSCVECLTSRDCFGDCCFPETHSCGTLCCATGTKVCDSCTCAQCCSDQDCLEYPEATGLCLPDGTCEGVMACGGLCNEVFPVCAVVQGAEQCVQCKVDADCAAVNAGCTCTGDPIYACVDEAGAICQKDETCTAVCQTDADCPLASNGASLSCSVVDGSGICFDPTGSCDGVSLCCAVGQKCFDLTVLLFGVMGAGGMPVEIPPHGLGYCTCDDANPCISGKDCTDMAVLCTDSVFVGGYGELICPGGQLSPSFPPKLCVNYADLMGGIF